MRIFLSLVVVLLVFPAVSTAEESKELRVMVVDIERALASSRSGEKAQEKYKEEVQGLQRGLDKKKKEFEKLREAFSKQRDSLNAKARGQKEEELIEMKKDIERSLEDAEGKLRRKNAQIVSELMRKIRGVVAEIGKEEGYTFVLEKNAPFVLYSDGSVDITKMVAKRFDEVAQ